MNTTLIIIFSVSVFAILWTYFGYFIFLKIISIVYERKIGRADFKPEVSLIITAHNEEKNLAAKLDNCLTLDYPIEKLQIILVSEGSTDRTVEIAGRYSDRGIELLELPIRRGKHYGQGEGIKIAKSEIVVLTDATTFLEPDSLKNIVANFADESVGCVSGIDVIKSSKQGQLGEGAYVNYEMKLRELESRVCSLVGASGSFYALRKEIAEKWYPDMSSDFYIPLVARTRGYRTVLDKTAVGYYKILKDPNQEFQRKVRTVVHGIDVLLHFRHILNPFKYGLFSAQVISHKLLRWAVPFAMILAFIANLFLAIDFPFFKILLYCQAAFYGLTVLAYLVKGFRGNPIFNIPFFFVMANYSILVAWIEYARGERYVTWQSTKR